jgi:hypothetical protein
MAQRMHAQLARCENVLVQYFKGRALVKLKTYPDDPYYASYFEGKKRLFEVQVCICSNIG